MALMVCAIDGAITVVTQPKLKEYRLAFEPSAEEEGHERSAIQAAAPGARVQRGPTARIRTKFGQGHAHP